MTLFDMDFIIWLMRGNKAATAAINTTPVRAMSAVYDMEHLRGAPRQPPITSMGC